MSLVGKNGVPPGKRRCFIALFVTNPESSPWRKTIIPCSSLASGTAQRLVHFVVFVNGSFYGLLTVSGGWPAIHETWMQPRGEVTPTRSLNSTNG
jgi:hypothetical protein